MIKGNGDIFSAIVSIIVRESVSILCNQQWYYRWILVLTAGIPFFKEMPLLIESFRNGRLSIDIGGLKSIFLSLGTFIFLS